MFSLKVKNPLKIYLFYEPSKKKIAHLEVCDVFFDVYKILGFVPVSYTFTKKIAHFVRKY